MQNCGISFGNDFKIVGNADTFIQHLAFLSGSRYGLLLVFMKLKPIFIFTLVLAVVMVISLPFVMKDWDGLVFAKPTESATVPTEGTTEEPTEAPTEPQPPVYTLSFVGDCTLGCNDQYREQDIGFIKTVGEDYDYPMANVRHIFEADDFTIANLEGPLTESGAKADKQFVFRGPAAYTAILTGSSIEAVTTANNHSWDYGYSGQADTAAALDAAGVAHAGREASFLYTTDSGLTIGVYCDDFAFDKTHITESIAALREQGAEVVICAFHWGEEKVYTPNGNQISWGRIAIDAGADIVYGHHAHVLQPIESYNGGVIFYGLGNFSFGGNVNPSDMDTAILQQQFVRQPDGTLTMGDTIAIPCSISSVADRNNYQPTPLAEGSEAYDRVMSKLGLTE